MNTGNTNNPLPSDVLKSVCQPIAGANGLPNRVYDDAELFTFERDRVLGHTWAGLEFISNIPKKGYAKPVDFMGLSLAIFCNREGDIKVFHNVCSHRGMVLIREETEVIGKVRCPYHSWTYDLDGNLKGTPHIGGAGIHTADGFECKNHGLKEIRCSIWMGMIFINLSGDTESFEQFIQPLEQRWQAFLGKYGIEQIQVAATGSSMELQVESNWKLAVENFCESYHLPWVHPALNTYSPLDQHYNILEGDRLSGQGTYCYNPASGIGSSLPEFNDWPKDKLRQAEYIALYPNVLLGIQVDHTFAIILQPLAHNRTLEKIEISYVGEESIGDEYAANRSAVLDSWKAVFGEDVFAVEGMQNGRKSPAFKGGVFSPVLDEATHHFHQWVANCYSRAEN